MGIEKVKGPRTFIVGPLSGGLFPVLFGCESDLWSVEAESMLRVLMTCSCPVSTVVFILRYWGRSELLTFIHIDYEEMIACIIFPG